MANTSDPYRRLGSNSWEELLDQVNDELQNPPNGCDPIDPIDIPDECHRWAKSDIREVHDKLDEMPGNCFTFELIPDLWKISIIEDIEGQLGEAWCDCGEERCCYDCANCGTQETIFLLTETADANDCTGCSTSSAEFNSCQTIKNGIFKDAADDFAERAIYSSRQFDWCNFLDELAALQAELEELEDELLELEDELDECGIDPVCIADKQQEIDDKQQEIDDKQQEVDDKQQEVDDSETDWMDAKATSDPACAAAIAAIGQMATPCGGTSVFELVKSFTRPLPTGLVDVCFDPDDASPAGPAPFCCGRDWWECNTSWTLRRKTYSTVSTSCSGDPLTPFVGSFQTIMSGDFDIDGTLCPLNLPSSGCPPTTGNLAYCFSSCCCCSSPCGACCGHPDNDLNVDYQIKIFTRICFGEFDCGGGPCGDGVEG